MNENFIHFLRQRPDIFPLQRDIDLERVLAEAIDSPDALPVPAKIFLVDELEPHSYGFPLTKAPALDDLEVRLDKWLMDEVAARTGADPAVTRAKADESLAAYRTQVEKIARNALHSSILADYHSVFWLVHSDQASRLFTSFPRRAMNSSPVLNRDQADALKYALSTRWAAAMRETVEKPDRFVSMLLENPFIATEEHISPDLRELRGYFTAHLHRDAMFGRNWIEGLRTRAAELMVTDRVFRRAVLLLGYPDRALGLLALLDRRVQQLILDHPSTPPQPDQATFEVLSKRLLEYFIVYHLRRGVLWMNTNADGDNIADDAQLVYSRAIRPMNFGRRGIVEPIVYRYGLVYDITSFTQTLGEIARGGKEGEQSSYRQMLEFQRDLAEVTRRYGLQFEKFLGDGAFYTSRRATRTIQAAIAIQQFYSSTKAKGFAFNKGMRIALNYGYYRLLPMQVSTDGTEIKEFYGPGIVELSRLTTGKATKEIEDIQHLLLSHGYDQMEVYKFFAPLARGADRADSSVQQREFYAYVNENGHLINEGIVVSIPFLKQLSAELSEDQEKMYRLRAPWSNYLGFRAANEGGVYIGVRLLGSVSLKGIGNMEVGEVVRLAHDEAEVSMVDEEKPFVQLLQQERNRSAASQVSDADSDVGLSDLVVCESHIRGADGTPVILVGEWDPVSEEVRRPIRLDDQDAERYGLAIPLTAETVESQSVAYQKLYRKLSRLETLPSFSVQAIRDNTNFSGFIIGATVERL